MHSCKVVHDVTSSDHSALWVYLQLEVGCWNAGQHKPIVTRPCLDLSKIDNLAPEFQRKLNAVRTQCVDLESLEREMGAQATEVCGLKPSNTSRKPFLNNSALKLKTAIKGCRTLLYMYNRGGVVETKICSEWNSWKGKLVASDCVPLLLPFFTEGGSPGHQTEAWPHLGSD